jgi:dihydrofolate reductase
MGTLLYSMITSLDGYVVDAEGSFDWAEPDREVFEFVTERTRDIGTYLMGRRMYELMQYWDTPEAHAGDEREYAAVWSATDKVVFSTTLQDVTTARTTLQNTFDPDLVARLKSLSSTRLSVEGPTFAAHALRAGLVDEIEQYLVPVVVGGGIPFFPADLSLDLELLDERRFESGVVWLRYGCR